MNITFIAGIILTTLGILSLSASYVLGDTFPGISSDGIQIMFLLNTFGMLFSIMGIVMIATANLFRALTSKKNQ